jgi:hypothetical protein
VVEVARVIVDAAIICILNVSWVLYRLLGRIWPLEMVILRQIAHLATIASPTNRANKAFPDTKRSLRGLGVVTVPGKRGVLFLFQR